MDQKMGKSEGSVFVHYIILLYFYLVKKYPMIISTHAILTAQMRNLRIEVPVLVLLSLRYPLSNL